jgi:hypothetical protein
MLFADLKLPVATRLQLNFIGLDYKRYLCDALLLGFRVGESVLVYLPNKPPQVLLRQDMKVEATVVRQTGIARFESAIAVMRDRPYSYLHLDYPTAVALEPLRRTPRFAFDGALALIAYTGLGIVTARQRGRFCDISLEGARLATDKELTSTVTRLALTATVTVAGMQHSLEITGELKRSFGRDEKMAEAAAPFVYGVSFVELPPPQRLLLLALCHELQSGRVYGEA